MTTVVNAWGCLVFHAAWQAAVVAAVILVTVRLAAAGRHRSATAAARRLSQVCPAADYRRALGPVQPLGAADGRGRTDGRRAASGTSTGFHAAAAPDGFEMPPFDDALPEPAMESLEHVEIRQVASSLPAVSQAVPRPWNWTAALLVVHLLGMVIVAAWLAVQWLRLRQLQASAREVADESIRERFKRLAALLGMRRSVRLLAGAGDSVPCSFGLLCPVVIVPESLIRDPAGDLDRVLAHELAHHRRGDLWVNAAQLALFAVWWFHPLYWLLHRSLRASVRTAATTCCWPRGLLHRATIARRFCEWLPPNATPVPWQSPPAWPTIPTPWRNVFAGSWTGH